MLWITLYFMNSATRDWAAVPKIGYVLQICALLGCFFIPESPKFLLEQNRLSELRKCLLYVANCNGKHIDFNVGSLRRYSDVSAESSPVMRDRIDSLISQTSQTSLQVSVLNQVLAGGHKKKTKSLCYWFK